ncbi:hypothetical protein BH09PAT2_BH09PAT2_08460 [soil metagenome]
MKGTAKNIIGWCLFCALFSIAGMAFGRFVLCALQPRENGNTLWAIVRRESVAGAVVTIQYTLFEY